MPASPLAELDQLMSVPAAATKLSALIAKAAKCIACSLMVNTSWLSLAQMSIHVLKLQQTTGARCLGRGDFALGVCANTLIDCGAMITMGLRMLDVIAHVVPCGLLCLVVCCATACEASR